MSELREWEGVGEFNLVLYPFNAALFTIILFLNYKLSISKLDYDLKKLDSGKWYTFIIPLTDIYKQPQPLSKNRSMMLF